MSIFDKFKRDYPVFYWVLLIWSVLFWLSVLYLISREILSLLEVIL